MVDQVSRSGAAVRADGLARVEARWIRAGPESIFSVAHLPDADPRAELLVCSPILGEALVTSRREVNLGRMAAGRGIAVQRFHYRGTGHSTGSETKITFEDMVDDGLAALEALEARVGSRPAIFLGIRWGALVAAECARRASGDSLVVWDPVMDPKAFLQEAIRARVMRRMKKRQGRRTSMNEEVAELEARGWLDILGYRLPASLIESTGDRSLDAILSDWKGRVAIVGFDARGGRRAAGLKPGRSLDSVLSRADRLTAPQELPVWFSGRSTQGSRELLETTVDWIVESLDGVSRT